MKYWATCLLCINLPVFAAQTIYLNQVFWPPFFINTKSGPEGFAANLLQRCIDPTQYRLKYLQLPIKRTHYYMQTGELDLTVYSYKAQREQDVWYGTEPLFITEYGFAVRADSTVEVRQLADLRPLKFGQLAGLSHTPELMRLIEEKRSTHMLVEGYNLDKMFDLMLQDPPRFDIMANSKETFVFAAAERKLTDKIKVLDFTVEYRPYYVTVSKQSKHIPDPRGFIEQVDHCINRLKQTGEYQKMAKAANFSPPNMADSSVTAPKHN